MCDGLLFYLLPILRTAGVPRLWCNSLDTPTPAGIAGGGAFRIQRCWRQIRGDPRRPGSFRGVGCANAESWIPPSPCGTGLPPSARPTCGGAPGGPPCARGPEPYDGPFFGCMQNLNPVSQLKPVGMNCCALLRTICNATSLQAIASNGSTGASRPIRKSYL